MLDDEIYNRDRQCDLTKSRLAEAERDLSLSSRLNEYLTIGALLSNTFS